MLHWAVHLKGAPKQHDIHAAVAAGHQLFSFGGYSYATAGDHQAAGYVQIGVHVFNTVSLRWRKLPPATDQRGERPGAVPSIRHAHTAVLIEDTVYIWGGWPYCHVLYLFDVDTHGWFRPAGVSGSVPDARYGHSACVLGAVMYIHGGVTDLRGHANDIYTLDSGTMVWSIVNTRGMPPPASEHHSATIIGTSMFVFGGWGGWVNQWDDCSNLRVFDTETNWLSTPSSAQSHRPRRRVGHSAFSHGGELYVFGGRNANRTFDDLWKYNPETFSWRKVKPKGRDPCRMHRMCCCVLGDRVVLYGGYKVNNSAPSDLYILDFNPSLNTLCKRAVLRYRLGQSELPYDLRWELAAMMKKKPSHARRKKAKQRAH